MRWNEEGQGGVRTKEDEEGVVRRDDGERMGRIGSDVV
jgi:hypothetical protein